MEDQTSIIESSQHSGLSDVAHAFVICLNRSLFQPPNKIKVNGGICVAEKEICVTYNE